MTARKHTPSSAGMPEFKRLRAEFLKRIAQSLLSLRPDSGVPNFADAGTKRSVAVATKLVEILGFQLRQEAIDVQTVGTKFAAEVCEYLKAAFSLLAHVRPGSWHFSTTQANVGIGAFDQYEHLPAIQTLLGQQRDLQSALGSNYLIRPDITVAREPLTDAQLNTRQQLVDADETVARRSPLRAANREQTLPTLHACISCKWTMRTDRAQNARTEALNLIRNRKGHVPHISLVTFEPTPNIIASMALGTGDLDCVYHPTLPELIEAVREAGSEDAQEMLEILVAGRRLRDLSDLPLDLAL